MPPFGGLAGAGTSKEELKQALNEKMEQWYATVATFAPQIKEVLTPAQYTRLQQIGWQATGTAACSDPEVIKLIGISKEQTQTIDSVIDECRSKRIAALRAGDGEDGGRGDLVELAEKMKALVKQQDAKILQALTKAQLDQFAMLKGQAFDVDALLDEDQRSGAEKKTAQATPGRAETRAANAAEPANANSQAGVGMIALITMDAVLTELGVEKNSDEHVKIRELLQRFPGELNRRLNNPTEEDRSRQLTAKQLYAVVESELVSDLKKLLKPEQFTRLRQIHWRQRGIDSVNDPDVATPLGISDDQKQKLASADEEMNNQRKAFDKQREELRAKGEGLDEIQKKIQDLETEKTAKYNAILTADQREKLTVLMGKPFEMPQIARAPGLSRGPIQTRPGGLMSLALREPVLKELGIDKDAAIVADIRKLMVEHSTELIKQLRELNPVEREKAKEIESNLQTKYNPELKKLLTPEQFARLRQIHWQQQGVQALDDAEIVLTLDLTKEQREQLSKMNDDITQKRIKLLNPPGGRPLGPVSEEIQTKMKELLTESETRASQILTQSQLEKYAELIGKPFDLALLRQQPNTGPGLRIRGNQ